MDNSFLYFILGLVAFIVGIFITRAVFSIPSLVDYQRKQYLMLKLMAEKMKVDADEILKVDDIEKYRIKMRNDNKEYYESEKENSN